MVAAAVRQWLAEMVGSDLTADGFQQRGIVFLDIAGQSIVRNQACRRSARNFTRRTHEAGTNVAYREQPARAREYHR